MKTMKTIAEIKGIEWDPEKKGLFIISLYIFLFKNIKTIRPAY